MAKVMEATRLHRLSSRLHPWHGLVILNYHRIGDAGESMLDRSVFSGTAEQLGHQIDLVRQHADLIGPGDVATVLDPGSPKGRHVLLTFDDGYRDNYELAFPMLREKGVAATFFINSGFLDAPRLPWNDEISWIVRSSTTPSIPPSRWFDKPISLVPESQDGTIAQVVADYIALQSDPERTTQFLVDLGEACGIGRAPVWASDKLWMTWEMVREMQVAGMEIGGHTINHPVLADESTAVQDAEIRGVRDRLITETGVAPKAFSYPYGGLHQFTEVTKSLVAKHGYTHGYSFYGGYNVPGAIDPFDIQRLYITGSTSDTALIGLVTLPQVYGLVPPRLPWKR